MIKKKNKKKNKILITLCAMFIAIASVFSFVSFNKQDELVVSADAIESSGFTFNGSPFLIPISYDESSSNIPTANQSFDITMFSASFSVNDQGYLSKFWFKFNGPLSYYMNDPSSGMIFNPDDDDIVNSWISGNFFTSAPLAGSEFYNYYVEETAFGYVHTQLIVDSYYDVINNNYYWKFGVPIKVYIEGSTNFRSSQTTFSYYDKDNNVLSFRVFYSRCDNGNYNAFNLPGRFYYFSDALNLTDNQYYQQGYDTGLSNGYNTGYNAGYDTGNSEGYDLGYNVGFNSGYSEGAEDSNQYTFLNLISATIDAPIKYFQSLFNFELLGVNLQGFLTGLFTLCVIVTIIKIVI